MWASDIHWLKLFSKKYKIRIFEKIQFWTFWVPLSSWKSGIRVKLRIWLIPFPAIVDLVLVNGIKITWIGQSISRTGHPGGPHGGGMNIIPVGPRGGRSVLPPALGVRISRSWATSVRSERWMAYLNRKYVTSGRLGLHVVFGWPYYGKTSKRKFEYPKGPKRLFCPWLFHLFSNYDEDDTFGSCWNRLAKGQIDRVRPGASATPTLTIVRTRFGSGKPCPEKCFCTGGSFWVG